MIHALVLILSLLAWVESVGMRGYHACDYGILCYTAKVKGFFANLVNVSSQLTLS